MHKRSSSNISMDMSMWLKRCTLSSQFEFSSQEIVLDQEDLLTLILLRVSYRKLKSLKCVSRKWLYLITTPQFSRLLCNLLPPLRASALFIQRPPIGESGRPCPNEVYFVPLDDPNTPSPFKTHVFANDPFHPECIRILGSCNGLLLCLAHSRYVPSDQRNCYVYNPSTSQLAILPKHPPGTQVDYIGLAFDPSKSPHYKVIAFVFTSLPDSVGDFHIYSSETGTWRVSLQCFSPPLDMYFDEGIYWKGCVHWLSKFHIKYEPASAVPDGLYFNVDEGRVETFPRPPISVELTSERSLYFGESESHLHFIEVCPTTTSLSVHEMKSDYSEWFSKYQIDLAPISKVFPEMTKHKDCLNGRKYYAVAVLSLIRRENFREDSFLVLEIPGKAIRYNLVDRSFKVIWDIAVELGVEKVDEWDFGRISALQYIETLSCV